MNISMWESRKTIRCKKKSVASLTSFLCLAILSLLLGKAQPSPQTFHRSLHTQSTSSKSIHKRIAGLSCQNTIVGWTSAIRSCDSESKNIRNNSAISHLLFRGGSSAAASASELDDIEVEDEKETEDEKENDEVIDDVNEYDDEEEEEEDDDEEEEQYDEDEYDEDESDLDDDEADPSTTAVDVEYDTMLMPSSMQSMGVTLGVMIMTRKLDFSDAMTIKYARYIYLAYIIGSQIFLAYVRLQAKLIHDTTPITITNPLTSLVKNQLNSALKDKIGSDSSSEPNVAKTLTDKFLSSQSTIMEYDVNQSRKLGSGMLFSLAFMWFLHFKMNQVQPLFYQTASGILNLVYSPLFQVYVLGRNLERPFKPPTPAGNPFLAQAESENVEGEEKIAMDDDEEKDEEVEEVEEAESELAEQEDDDGEESDDDEEGEYDEDDE